MKKYKKISLSVLAIVLILYLILILGLPRILNLESIQKKILNEFSQKVGGEFSFDKIGISLFPLPNLEIQNGSFNIEDGYKYSGTFESISISPEILPLLKGKIRLHKIVFESPDILITLPEKIEKKPSDKQQEFSFLDNLKLHFNDLVSLGSKAPDLILQIDKGEIHISKEHNSIFSFSNVQANYELEPDEIKIKFGCNSDFAKSISFKGVLDLNSFKGTGDLKLAQMQPHVITGYLFPNSTDYISNSLLNLSLTFITNKLTDLKAEVEGSIPRLLIHRQNDKTHIKAKKFKGSIVLDEDQMKFSLAEMNLVDPELKLNGSFSIDKISNQVFLDLEGREVDVRSTRKTALAILKGDRVTQEIFEIVRGGKVPWITFTSHGNDVSELGRNENYFIKGQMEDGEIFIPYGNLNLKDASGSVVISNGILEGEDLTAMLGNSKGSKAKLRVGLSSKKDVFSLDVVVDADLSQLPPYLVEMIESQEVTNEIKLIKDLHGYAQGRLILGDTKSNINTIIDVWKFELTANSPRLPYPVNLKGGNFLFDKSTIELRKLKGNISQTSFSDLGMKIDWGKDAHLEIDTLQSKISLEELLPWLKSFESLDEYLKNLKTLNGEIEISSLKLKGPVLNPEYWEFQMITKGNLNSNIGPKFSIDLIKNPKELIVKNFAIQDKESDANIDLTRKGTLYEIKYSGQLKSKTLDKIFTVNENSDGWLKGNIQLRISTDKPLNSTAQGKLEGGNIYYPLKIDEPIKIESISLNAEKNNIVIDSLDLSLGNNNIGIQGTANLSSDKFVLDMNISADKIEWDKILKLKGDENEKEHSKSDPKEKPQKLPVEGIIRLKSENFEYDSFTWSPFNADISFENETVSVLVKEANLCGISTPGTIVFKQEDLKLNIKPEAKNQDLETTLACLFNVKDRVSGSFDFNGVIESDGTSDKLLESLQGNLKFVSKDGKINHKLGILKSIVSTLNITEIFRGKLPDLSKNHLSYSKLTANGDFQDGDLKLEELAIDSPSMGIVGDGNINLVDKKVDIKLYVAPIKVLDSLVKKIPLVKRIRGGNLLSIPFTINGDLSDPKVTQPSK